MNEIEMAIDAIGIALAQEPPAAIEQGYGFYLVIEDALATAHNALREKAEREKLLQWLDDMDNPLEPIKIESALRSEMMKLEFRKANRPKDVSILDYTIIAALAEALRQRLEVEP